MLIGELSRRTGVSPRLLRYYEAQGLLTADRGANGYRTYDEGAERTVRQVRALLDAGLSTEIIRTVLPCTYGDTYGGKPRINWCTELRTLVDRELDAMNERINALQRSRDNLAGYLAHS
ncbi:MerR family transcriptional regulator [Streptomyces sp. AJS327]|uniref:MerR family transcriptional regulator n=1 Tax=Streptomyces sp. AJS327 TaxID=2545265 RepID=UPI0015DE9F6F|nr:MerR family transcriptional regulator [Streptomyces sp. AJS327]MBA0053134.1 MerR family transcriptional regulator [Streptomyces sp. AJS327]